jgi:uncharacterized membrane protein
VQIYAGPKGGYTELILPVKLVTPSPRTHTHTHTHTALLKLTSLMYITCDVILPLVRVTIVALVKQCLIYYECVFVALVIQHATSLRRIICGQSDVQYLSALSFKSRHFRGGGEDLFDVSCEF